MNNAFKILIYILLVFGITITVFLTALYPNYGYKTNGTITDLNITNSYIGLVNCFCSCSNYPFCDTISNGTCCNNKHCLRFTFIETCSKQTIYDMILYIYVNDIIKIFYCNSCLYEKGNIVNIWIVHDNYFLTQPSIFFDTSYIIITTILVFLASNAILLVLLYKFIKI